MIGIGIYVSSGYSLASLHDAKYVLAVWLIAGLHAIAGAVAYAAVAERLPISGGEFSILTKWVHPSIGFVAAWISIVAGFAAPIAASAKLLGYYVCQTLDLDGVPNLDLWIATSVILVATTVHLIGIALTANINNFVVSLKLLGLLIFLAFGIWYLCRHGSDGMYPSRTASVGEGGNTSSLGTEQATWQLGIAILGSLFFTTLSYTGFNASIYLAGEYASDRTAKPNLQTNEEPANPNHSLRNFRYGIVGKSMIAACILVTLLYLGLNTVFLYSLPGETIVEAGEGFVLLVAEAVGGNMLRVTMAWLIILSCLTSVLSMSITGPQVPLQMASEYRLFSNVSRLRLKNWALLGQALLTLGFIWLTPLRDLVTYLGLTLTACGGLAIASLWFATSRWNTNKIAKSPGAEQRLSSANNQQVAPLTNLENVCVTVYVAGAIILLIAGSWIVPYQFLSCLISFGVGGIIYLICRKQTFR